MAANLILTLTGGAGNTDPDASLGGTGSSEELSGTALNNLFDDVDPDEASAGDTEYRAIDIYNDGDAEAINVSIWFEAQSSSGDTAMTMGKDDTATQTLADESTAPAAPVVTFTAPTSGSPLAVSNIAAGARQRIFIKRVTSASAGNDPADLMTLKCKYA